MLRGEFDLQTGMVKLEFHVQAECESLSGLILMLAFTNSCLEGGGFRLLLGP